MTPEQWLKTTQMVKVRNKLAGWGRQDLINLALQEFRKQDLSKPELGRLIAKLKDPAIKRPVVAIELTSNPELVESDDFQLKPNVGQVGHPNTEWHWASGRAGLRFKDTKDATRWALDLILKDATRSNWPVIYANWNKQVDIRYFDPRQWPGIGMNPVFEKLLAKKQRETKRLTTPLPDNSTIKKRYWSLEEGDKLVDPESKHWVVKSTRVNLDGPPTLHLEAIDGN